MSLLELEAVSKRFGERVALRAVSLRVEPRSTVALVGPNGAGKSTLIAVALGLRRADAGDVRIVGCDPRSERARRAVAAVMQESAFPQTLRVEEVVRFAADHFAMPAPVDHVLDLLGVRALARRPLGGLSGGERRRVAIALALVSRAELLVLDEPTAGLDPEARRAVWHAVESAVERGAAALVATHHLDEAEAVATRVVAIDDGRISADGSVEELRRRAGGSLIRFRTPSDASVLPAEASVDGRWVSIVTQDPGSLITTLVLGDVSLSGLEVRPLRLEESLVRMGHRQ